MSKILYMRKKHFDGFLKESRDPIGYRDPQGRTDDYKEIYKETWDVNQLRHQGKRCMSCGVPTCMAGCPIGNLIPEWNDLAYQDSWEEALNRLHNTNNFPEFTGYTCPAPCEPACVLAYNDEPVTIKDLERAIVDRGWEMGWIKPKSPSTRTNYKVAVVGSGPAGLSAAQQLNRAGHNVTVFERDDVAGGMMTYGIPDFKFAKFRVARRIEQLTQEGIEFKTNTELGKDISLEELRHQYHATALTIGAQKHRDVSIPGRELAGVSFAMTYLIRANRIQAGLEVSGGEDAKDKHVVVLGGGDTGADCVATAHRQGAKSVTQISIREKPPAERPTGNPWPTEPWTYIQTYAIAEGGIEEYGLNSLEFLDTNQDGRVDTLKTERVEWEYDDNRRRTNKTTVAPDVRMPADLVLIAAGFSGAQTEALHQDDLETTRWGTLQVDDKMMTNIPGVFAAGDANLGASLVVWAIGDGRDVAHHIDDFLVGETQLPKSLRSKNKPMGGYI
ncbi:MAG: glutamate synthase subunit beta [Pseudomonadota bacterium]